MLKPDVTGALRRCTPCGKQPRSVGSLHTFAWLLLAWIATSANATVTTQVVDIPVVGATQRYLLVAPERPIATIVSVPDGDGTYGIQNDGSMTTRVSRCSPIARTRQALAERGFAVALVDADSTGQPWKIDNVEAVMRDLRGRFAVPLYIMGGSAATATISELGVVLPDALPGGVILVSPGFPDANVSRIRRPSLVIYHVGDTDQFGFQTFNALTSAVVREQAALSGGNNLGCGHHLFSGLDAEFANTTASFIETHNFLSLAPAEPPARVTLTVNSAGELRQAIASANQHPQQIHVVRIGSSPLQLDALQPGGDALPVIRGQLILTPSPERESQGVTLRGGGAGSNFRLASVDAGGSLRLGGITAEDFHGSGDGGVLAFRAGSRGEVLERLGGLAIRQCSAAGDGGAIHVGGAAYLLAEALDVEHCTAGGFGGAVAVRDTGMPIDGPHQLRGSRFANNAALDGGAIHADSPVDISTSRFTGNRAAGVGGAIALRGSGLSAIDLNAFDDNLAGVSGGTIHLAGPFLAGEVGVSNNQIRAGDTDAPVEHTAGPVRFQFNTVDVQPDRSAFQSSAGTELHGNVLDDSAGTGKAGTGRTSKRLCAGPGAAAMVSRGANIATDASCGLVAPTDLVSAALGLASDVQGFLRPGPDSPAIERGPSGLLPLSAINTDRFELPCGYRDVTGLGRPQDGDGDGRFACDSGAIERQAGPDLSARQSGAYFDAGRSGEGHLIEVIGGGLAVVSTYTFGVDGGVAWFTGIGQVVGNSVVVDAMEITTGGVFGPGFDPDAIERRRVGGASFVFPDCAASSQPGHFAFQGRHEGEFEDMATAATRLTSILPCSGSPGALAHRSGSYYDPARSGEGVFVQYQPDGTAVLVFYGYTPRGQQFWAIAGSTSIAGDTLTAQMLYPAGTSRFGSRFVSGEVDLQPWGTMRLRHTGCNSATLSYEATVEGYGSGSYDYVRLTAIEGADCP